jgi:hypothetical protein
MSPSTNVSDIAYVSQKIANFECKGKFQFFLDPTDYHYFSLTNPLIFISQIILFDFPIMKFETME